ncbi:hypothetical protein HK099_005601 [Clydaea vesicula]|uniref:Uncharacterized protein n=1 Tax=Clydaea vesicula TaxID=447962 RepID=A0AAD5U2A2_9FUNG|nr:hypothetical protein HK099_005601 [Clydaea vesicula]
MSTLSTTRQRTNISKTKSEDELTENAPLLNENSEINSKDDEASSQSSLSDSDEVEEKPETLKAYNKKTNQFFDTNVVEDSGDYRDVLVFLFLAFIMYFNL